MHLKTLKCTHLANNTWLKFHTIIHTYLFLAEIPDDNYLVTTYSVVCLFFYIVYNACLFVPSTCTHCPRTLHMHMLLQQRMINMRTDIHWYLLALNCLLLVCLFVRYYSPTSSAAKIPPFLKMLSRGISRDGPGQSKASKGKNKANNVWTLRTLDGKLFVFNNGKPVGTPPEEATGGQLHHDKVLCIAIVADIISVHIMCAYWYPCRKMFTYSWISAYCTLLLLPISLVCMYMCAHLYACRKMLVSGTYRPKTASLTHYTRSSVCARSSERNL